MKTQKVVLEITDGAQSNLNVLLQPGWYQYMIVEHDNALTLTTHYYRHTLISKEDNPGAGCAGGGVKLHELIKFTLLTSGAVKCKTRYLYKLFNLEIKKPTYYTISIKVSTGSNESSAVYFKFTEEKLQEVV